MIFDHLVDWEGIVEAQRVHRPQILQTSLIYEPLVNARIII